MAQVNNLTISCIDFRFRPKVAQWIDDTLEGQSDLAVLAGSSKAILDDDTQASILKQVELAQMLHHITTVHVLDHIDCGAYGGSAKFEADKPAEVKMHQEQLAQAAAVIKAKFPDLEVKTAIVDFDGVIE